jgi:hypothetical protein
MPISSTAAWTPPTPCSRPTTWLRPARTRDDLQRQLPPADPQDTRAGPGLGTRPHAARGIPARAPGRCRRPAAAGQRRGLPGHRPAQRLLDPGRVGPRAQPGRPTWACAAKTCTPPAKAMRMPRSTSMPASGARSCRPCSSPADRITRATSSASPSAAPTRRRRSSSSCRAATRWTTTTAPPIPTSRATRTCVRNCRSAPTWPGNTTLEKDDMLSVSAFTKRIRDITLDRLFEQNGVWIVMPDNMGAATVRGLEFEAKGTARRAGGTREPGAQLVAPGSGGGAGQPHRRPAFRGAATWGWTTRRLAGRSTSAAHIPGAALRVAPEPAAGRLWRRQAPARPVRGVEARREARSCGCRCPTCCTGTTSRRSEDLCRGCGPDDQQCAPHPETRMWRDLGVGAESRM